MVDVVVSIAASIAAKVAELLVVPIGKHLCYPFKYKSNIDELKKQVNDLRNQSETVQNSVNAAVRQGDEILEDVGKWLKSVDDFAEKVAKPIIDDEDKAKKLCSIGFCSNLMTRYTLSKKAAKTAKDGVNLLGKGAFKEISYRPPLRKTQSFYTRGYEDFDSRLPVFEKIMETLKDGDGNLIGVYGMGGVGKTTLVNSVAAQAIKDKLFDFVVMTEVTQTPNLKTIQEEIADSLGLKFHEPSVSARAARLRDRLKKEKRVLVILDNIWQKLDLEALGIPLEGDEKGSAQQKEVWKQRNNDLSVAIPLRGDENGSAQQKEDCEGRNDGPRQYKILLTSRYLNVLSNDMNVQNNFNVQTLSYDEAWNMFVKVVGDSANNPDFNYIAVEVVKKCAGLPVAIATIANALKNKSDLGYWKDALRQLRRPIPGDIEGMDAHVYSAIKLSYNFLPNEEAKFIFLLCGLENAGYNISIEDLVRYCMGLCYFNDVDTLEEGRTKLHGLIGFLKGSCLLLDGHTETSVKMHDIVHTVAGLIARSHSDKPMFNIQNVTRLKEELEKKIYKESTAISLPEKDVNYELPLRLEFPKLQLFSLSKKDLSLQIPDTFFEGTEELKVLDLTKINLLSFPSSLGRLTKLQTLCLKECLLGDTVIIRKLKTLEILSFRNSDIKELPGEIKQLTRLRLLDLSNCSELKVIKPNVISCLTRLEELYMGDSFFQWEVEGQSNASLSELKQLSHLTILDMHVADARIMPQDLLIFEKLERYRIFIGDVWDWSGNCESSRTFKLKLNNSIFLGHGVKMLLDRTEALYLDEMKGFENVLYQLNAKGFPQLKHLHVQNCLEIQYIVNSIGRGQCNVFPRLESLFLHNLINLEKICHGQISAESFSKLRIIKVGKCDRLKNLFSLFMAKKLSQIQEIEVTDCEKLEEIVSKEVEDQVQENGRCEIEFTELCTLTLQRLPRLTNFSINLITPEMRFQEIHAEDEPDTYMPLFKQNVVLPNLKNLKLSSIMIECRWLDQLPMISSCFRALTNLTLEECNGLKFLFSCSMVKSLVELRKLEVWNCKSIEGIINTEDFRGEEIKMEFPKLRILQLYGLPEVTRFSSGNSVVFHSLTRLHIEYCPKFKTFLSDYLSGDIIQSKDTEETNYPACMQPLFDEKVAFPCLKELRLGDLPELLHLWKEDSQPSMAFENLTSLEVFNCGKLKTLVPSSASLKTLTTVTISECNGLMNLVTLSTAKTLVQLVRMDIFYCIRMQKIITDMGDEEIITGKGEKDAAIDKITFSMLKSIGLVSLPNLTSFYSGGNTLECPSLTDIEIKDCPKMETFVFPNMKDHCFHSVSLFNEKVVLPVLKFLDLSDIGIQTKWHNQFLLAMSCFQNLAELIMCGCDNLKYLFPSSIAESLVHLEILEVSNCKFMEGVIINQVEIKSSTLFPKLNKLKLKDLPELTRYCNFNGDSIELPSLSKLAIEKCPKMQAFVYDSVCADMPAIKKPEQVNTKTQQILHSFFDEKVAFPCLKELKLCQLRDMLHLCKEDSQPGILSKNLTSLQVYGCENLKTLVPPSVSLQKLMTLTVDTCSGLINLMTLPTAKTLAQLKRMNISHCKMMEKVIIDMVGDKEIMTAEGERDATIDNITFSMLKSIKLQGLPNLTSFYSGSNTLECPSLTDFEIKDCPKMETFVFPNTNEDLSILSASLFNEKVVLPMLKFLDLSDIGIQTKWHNQFLQAMSCFQNLTQLIMFGCDNLKYLFPSSIAESLVHLEILKVSNCKFMEGVIINQVEIKSSTLFPKLNKLKLKDLPELTRYCNFNGDSIELPSLSKLVIMKCPKMQAFISDSVCADMPAMKKPEQVNTKTEQVAFPCLKELKLCQLPDMLHMWKEDSQPGILSENLTILQVYGCENLKTLVPPSVSLQKLMTLTVDECNGLINLMTLPTAKTLVQLETMNISNCKMMEKVIIDMVGDEEIMTAEGEKDATIDKITFSMLQSVKLQGLPNLTSFYSGSNTLECPSLTDIEIKDCPKMETFVFPNTNEDLSIPSASLFNKKVAFPCLKELKLCQLRDMLHLCKEDSQPGILSENLTSLQVYGCENLKTLVPPSVSLQKLMTLTVDRCSGLINLMTLPTAKTLVQLDTMNISHCKMMEKVIIDMVGDEEIMTAEGERDATIDKITFSMLKSIKLQGLPNLTCFYSGSNTLKCPSLTDIEIKDCPKMETFVFPNTNEDLSIPSASLFNEKVAFPCLKKLKLCQLRDMLHLCKEDSQPGILSENLTSLQVYGCENLKTLVPPSVSLQKLMTLTVDRCSGLINLMTLPTAKTLVQLDTMNISHCKMMEKVIIDMVGDEEIMTAEGERDATMDKITFSMLKSIELQGLPNLTSFYSGSNTLDCPSLTDIGIKDCPKMETFVFPNMKDLCYHSVSLFNEKVVLPVLKFLDLSDIGIQTKWHNQFLLAMSCFQNLTELIMCGCDNLKYLFPSSIAESLVHLEILEVSNCKFMEGVIINQVEIKSSTLFPKLNKLKLKDLPELTRYCNFDGDSIELPSLSKLAIEKCPKMQAFVYDSVCADMPAIKKPEQVNTKTEQILHSFFDEKVAFPCLKELKLCQLRDMLHLCKEDSQPGILSKNLTSLQVYGCENLKTLVPPSVSLQKLMTLTVDRCSGLINLMTLPTAKTLAQLKRMNISHCKMMEKVIIDMVGDKEIMTAEGERDATIDNITFSMLKSIKLQGLPNLTSFYSGSNTLECPSLTDIEIEDCPKMETFVFPNTNEDLSIPSASLFNEKVAFPCLKELKLCQLRDMLHLCKEDSQPGILSENLTSLQVYGCENLKTLVPPSVSLQKLMTLTVDRCSGLINLMTLPTAKTLVQLDTMNISHCKMMEKVIIDIVGDEEIMTAEGERDATIDKITFSMLKSIKLQGLPNLTCFYSGSNTLKCPSLTDIEIKDCPKMETFVFPNMKDLCYHSVSLFNEKVVLPVLKFLDLTDIGIQTKWHNQFLTAMSCFQNLTELIICGCDNLKYLFPSSIAESLVHLEILKVSNCEFMEGVIINQVEIKSSTLFPKLNKLKLKDLPELTRYCNFIGDSTELPSLSKLAIKNCPKMQIFVSDSLFADMPVIKELEEVNTEKNLHSFFDEKVALPCMHTLELSELPQLLQLWKENSQPSKVFENLAYLRVAGCHNLETLVPSWTSLQNLVTLEVRKCGRLINFVTFSTAKSLEQLKIMKIIDCKMLEEIIIDLGDEVKDGIVFNQLKRMELSCLPSLTSFCTGNFTIEFPSLERVLVMECFKMMNFSQGVLSTPKIQRLWLKGEDEGCSESEEDEAFSESEEDEAFSEREGDEWCWERDLNPSWFVKPGNYPEEEAGAKPRPRPQLGHLPQPLF